MKTISMNETSMELNSIEDDLNGRLKIFGREPQQMMNLIEDNLNGRLPQWKITSMKYDLNERIYWKINSMEDNSNGRKNRCKTASTENNFYGR